METILPRVETLELTDTYGKFAVEPLERGYGVTLGNALRRVLLSSIPGAAVTQIRIDGVLHEFSTLPGVREDTTELILNLKDLHVRINHNGEAQAEPPAPEETVEEETEQEDDDAEEDQVPFAAFRPGPESKTLRIDVKGEGVVTGADVRCPPDVEVVNPGVVLARLTSKDASLSMEMTVEEGKGYRPPDRRERQSTAIGVIPVGAVFSPVRKANYIVEATRVGRKTDLERLIVEVWTNGTISPCDAVSESATVLSNYMTLFAKFPKTREARGLEMVPYAEEPVEPQAPEVRIEELDFSVRTKNCLDRENIQTIGDLVKRTEEDLMALRNFGHKSLNEVKEKLRQFGLSLAPSLSDKPARGRKKKAADEADEEEALADYGSSEEAEDTDDEDEDEDEDEPDDS
jgi:DNA-directed RNA polymerase subunit alpha